MVKTLEMLTGYLTTYKRHQILCGCITTLPGRLCRGVACVATTSSYSATVLQPVAQGCMSLRIVLKAEPLKEC